MGKRDFEGMRGEEYERLYARFLKRPVDELLELRGGVAGKNVLDICAGGLRASARAKELGADFVCAVDISEEMMEGAPAGRRRPDRCVVSDVSRWTGDGTRFVGRRDFHLAICQQAVNYWWNSETVGTIASVLRDDGYFVFNTFVACPDAVPKRKEYEIDGVQYAEEYWLVGNYVVHTQICGDEEHHSKFRWISEREFLDVLQDHFQEVECDVAPNKTTAIFVARKKLTNGN